MKLKPIITSLLGTDAYKFSMGNVFFLLFNNYRTRWTFKCRSKVHFTKEMVQEIREQFDYFCSLRFTPEQINQLRIAQPWLSEGYLNWLRFWHPVREEIVIQDGNTENPYGDQTDKVHLVPYTDCGLAVEFGEIEPDITSPTGYKMGLGLHLNTSMYEIALLQIVSEVYFAFTGEMPLLFEEFKRRTEAKVNGLKNGTYEIGKFSEFGLRRRLSAESHDWLVGYLKANAPGFVGTSDVELAIKHGVKAVGTMAHEFVQCVGQGDPRNNPAYSNHFAMKAWTDVYQTRNGIMLSDTIGTDVFLRDFDLTYATLFGGPRHDSGNPYVWGEKILSLYDCYGINIASKTLLFSNSLTFANMTDIYRHFINELEPCSGIGGYLATDTYLPGLNIVCKVTECNGSPVAKLSDDPGKGMCRSEDYVNYLQRTINWRLTNEPWAIKARCAKRFAERYVKLTPEQLAVA